MSAMAWLQQSPANMVLHVRIVVTIQLRVLSIPHVTIRTGLTTPNGHDEMLAEYFCDHPGCANIATQVLGCVVELRDVVVVCDEHAPKPRP